MKLAYSTNAYTRTSVEAAIESIAALGFEGVEILCDQPHWFAGSTPGPEVDRVAQRLAELGLGISNLNANTANGYYDPPPPENVFEPALTNPDRALREWRRDWTIETIELAARVGAPCVSITTGHPTPGCEPARALDYLVEMLGPVCEAGARHGVRVGIEYEPGLLIERAAELRALIERVGAEHLGANLDIGHSFLDGESPREAVAMLAGRIWNVHVEDIAARKHFHLVPGDGELPFGRYFDALRDAGYTGFLTVELYSYPHMPDEAGRRALAHLAPLVEDG